MSSTQGITLLGLGPSGPELLTRQAWDLITTIPEIYLRTRQHPVVANLPAGLSVHSFDEYFENGQGYSAVTTRIVEQIMALGHRPQGVVYAVPGHPFVAEAASVEIAHRAKREGLPVRIVEGLSFIEPTLAALGMALTPHTALVDALELAAAHMPPFPPDAPALVAHIHSHSIAAQVKLLLLRVYPAAHPVQLVHAAGTPQAQVEQVTLGELDRSPQFHSLTCLYLPPLPQGASFESFQEIIAHLRAPDGCPWDREQTHLSLRQHLLEEAYELLEALDAGDAAHMREEYGDLLLQIVLNAEIASELGEFTMAQVIQGIYEKIVRRHPHVFGEVEVHSAQDVLQNWEKLKAAEREEKGKSEASLLDGVARALPALVAAGQYQVRAARVGFDWPNIQGVIDKVHEELHEVHIAPDPAARAGELGDLLFAVVNLARWYDVDAESALRGTNARFRQRFSAIEAAARAQGKAVSDLTLDEMEALWQGAKS